MRINNNISALNAWRGLTNTDNSLSKSLEKLSSGLRINRAGDDAAGLAISEKMRGQIRGLNMAMKNAQDGISLIQTAEGALTESHAILQRMRELAVQSANDTNTIDDRKELQKELNQLIEELDRIAANTEFNTKTLLDGSFTGQIHIGANAGQAMEINVASMHTEAMGSQVSGYTVDTGLTINESTNFDDTPVVITVTMGKAKYEVTLSGKPSGEGGEDPDADDIADFAETIVNTLNDGLAGSGVTASVDEYGKLHLQNVRQFVAKVGDEDAITAAEGDMTRSVAELFNEDFDAPQITGGILTQEDADNAISVIDNAIKTVSGERSKLGAYQNRLEHTIKNLGVAAENLAAAESRIRDVDMAAEMMNFTKQNILMQAGAAMLAQANARPQSVLQLLG